MKYLLDEWGRILATGDLPWTAPTIAMVVCGHHSQQYVAVARACLIASAGVAAWMACSGEHVPSGAVIGHGSRPDLWGLGVPMSDRVDALGIAPPEAARAPTWWSTDPRAWDAAGKPYTAFLGTVVDETADRLVVALDCAELGHIVAPRRGSRARAGDRVLVAAHEGGVPRHVMPLADLGCWPGGGEP